jgi:hypothetical protein
MPGPVLTITSNIQCAHLGTCQAVNPVTAVKINGSAVVALSTTFTVTPCQAPTQSSGTLPVCVTAQFTMGPSTRVMTTLGPVLVSTSNGQSQPNLTPLVVVPDQFKVKAL